MQLLTVQQQALQDAKAYAALHIAEMVEEMIEFQDSGILKDGKVRQLAEICRIFAATSNLSVAQSLVTRAAYDFISQLGYHS
jgi:hypothetical protein